MQLAKAGFYSGDPEKVLAARVDLVIQAMQYDQFLNKYEIVDYQINKPS